MPCSVDPVQLFSRTNFQLEFEFQNTANSYWLYPKTRPRTEVNKLHFVHTSLLRLLERQASRMGSMATSDDVHT